MSNNINEKVEKYADLVVSAFLPIKRGSKLEIRVEPENYDFAARIAKAAYRKGAAYVEISLLDKYIDAERYAHVSDEDLTFSPLYRKNRDYEIIADEWNRLYIEETEQQDALEHVNKEKLKTYKQAMAQNKRRLMESVLASHMPWAVIAFPGPAWAKKVTGIENPDHAIAALWDILTPILRLDSNDPAHSWKLHCDNLVARAEKLTALKLKTLRFQSEGTDLEIGLSEDSQWIGGPDVSRSGEVFLPNAPTEEVFTTPDFTKTNGKARVTRPVMVYGTLVEGIELEFKDGKLINFSAEKNADIFESFVNTDEGARYLGEVALVDIESPIAKSGKFFNSILFDENAVSHIALGAGYPKGMKGTENLGSSELKAMGCNDSLVHVDFMIGSDDTTLTCIDFDGNEHVIMEHGTLFV